MRSCKKSSARQRRLRLTTASTGSSDTIETPSDASFVQDDEEERRLSNLIRANIRIFKQVFRFSRLRPDKSVEWAETARASKRILTASYIKNHRCMHPALYTSILHPGSLAQIIEELSRLRGDTPESAVAGWKKIRTRLSIKEDFTQLADVKNEACLRDWFVRAITMIDFISNHRQGSTTTDTFGLRGALAYESNNRSSDVHEEAAYFSQADLVFRRGSAVFAVVEFKMDRQRQRPWYMVDAVLAQIFCGLSGAESCRFGLVLTQTGFKFLYRIRVNDDTNGARPLYKYYVYPPGSEESLLQSLTVDKDAIACEDLMRIIYELTLTSSDRPAKRPRNAENSFDGISSENKRVDSLIEKLKSTNLGVRDYTAYKFDSVLTSGSVITLEGLSDLSEELLATYESAPDSDYD